MTIADLTFSLVINTTDRAYSLRTLLRTLEHQSYPYFEIIVVVGPTKDNTLEMLREYEDRLQILRCEKANLSQSRNIGLTAANGDIVAFIDDDAVPSYHWLAQLARLFQDKNMAATGGMVYMIHPSQPTVQHRIGIVSSLAEQLDVRYSWLEGIVPPGQGTHWIGRMMGTNMAFRRQALLGIGGFDAFFEWLYDDTDVSMRLAYAGHTIHPVKEAVVYHVPASSRNRVALSYYARWWVQTKSVIYFVIKYGPQVGESYRKIMLRCLHYIHGHWLWSQTLWRQKRITWWQSWKMRLAEVKSALIGVYMGVFRPRQLINPQNSQSISNDNLIVNVFQNDESAEQPAVDPVSGYQPAITIPDKPLRICLLSSVYPPDQYEGVGRHTNLMARGLFDCGHTVHVITHGDKDIVSFYDGAYVHKIPHTDRYGRYRIFPKLYHALNHSHAVHDKIKRLILNDGIQIIDSPLWQLDGLVPAVSNLLPVIVRLQTALRQIAMIQQNHDTDTRLMGEMEAVFIKQAAHLVPNSLATLDNVQKVYGLQPAPDQYTVIPHGIIPVPDEAIRPFDLNNNPGTFTILYVGRLEKRKGIQELFLSIPHVLKSTPKARFIIAGADNSHRDGFKNRTGMDYATYFNHHYRKYTPKVSFLGHVSEEKLHQLYQSCDLFVAPSLYESFGLIYLEAMNYAKPVIGCQAGGIPEVVEDGVTGFLVEPEAAKSLAEAILNFIKSPIKFYEMGLAGRQRLLDRFTHIQMARNFEKTYRHVIGKQVSIDNNR